MSKIITLIIATLYCCQICAKGLVEKIRIYGVVKPKMISTSVALGTGLVHKLSSEIGNKIKPGDVLLQVLERETLRDYRSTISGFIAKVHVTSGAAISPGMPLVTVVNPNKKFMEVSLSPTDARKIDKGVTVETPGGLKIGKIERISPIIDPETGAVVASFDLYNKKYRIGEVLPIDIVLGERSCDEITTLSEAGSFGKSYSIEFVNNQDACLIKRK
jgi:hypothetical protein